MWKQIKNGQFAITFPEEAKRVLISKLADLNFFATEINRQNLLSEGIKPEKIIVTGNTVIDSLLFAKDKVNSFSEDVTDSVVRNIFEKHHSRIILPFCARLIFNPPKPLSIFTSYINLGCPGVFIDRFSIFIGRCSSGKSLTKAE